MENSCVVNCPCCGQFIQIEFSIMDARAYPFYMNPCNALNAIYGITQNKEEDNDV